MSTKRIKNVFAVVRRLSLASTVTVAMVASAGAALATDKAVTVSVGVGCAEELGKYCTGKKSQAGIDCLEAKRVKLSAICHAALDNKPVTVATACAKEVNKYCTDKKYQQVGGLWYCLKDNRAKLSAVCTIVVDENGGGGI